MAVRLKNGAIFLHVPKTGGSWVTRVLSECGLVDREFSHIHADMVRVRYYGSGGRVFWRSAYEAAKSRLPRAWKARIMTPTRRQRLSERQQSTTPYTFCFVRHPLQWYESWWRYMIGRSGSDWSAESDLLGWHPCAAIKNCGDESYQKFIRNVIQHRPGFVSELFAQYAQPGISFIGKQESLTDDLIRVLRQLNLSFDEQRVREYAPLNVSSRDQATSLPQPLQAELERLEYVALIRYGYDSSSVVT